MKKTYSAPKANAMSLHIENEILLGSDLKAHDQYTSADQLSEKKVGAATNGLILKKTKHAVFLTENEMN